MIKRLHSARLRQFVLTTVSVILTSTAVAVHAKADSEAKPATFCRFVPERADDFAWENDKIAFRVYGPALKRGGENSGVDCWAKRVPYPILNKWYRLNHEEKLSYHQDRGEGADFYHVGKSRGCGGTAIWYQGKMLLSNVYTDWKIISSTPQTSVFRLSYHYQFDGRTIDEEKTISIALGSHVYKSESVFTEGGKPVSLEIAIGLTTHDQRGRATLDEKAGWMSVWEDYQGKTGKFATGVAIDPNRISRLLEIKAGGRDESHAIAIVTPDAKGRTIHYAGFAWARHGEMNTPKQWSTYLTKKSKQLATH